MNVKHSSKSSEWYTPPDIIEMARKVLGTIDLDPASSEVANKTVKATKYYSKEEDGLKHDWCGNIFVNPPGSKIGNQSMTALFWEKLMQSSHDHAIFLAFSIEALQVTQGKNYPPMTNYPMCIPSKRIKFIGEDESKIAPPHASVIIYVPYYVRKTKKFFETFSELGKVINL